MRFEIWLIGVVDLVFDIFELNLKYGFDLEIFIYGKIGIEICLGMFCGVGLIFGICFISSLLCDLFFIGIVILWELEME